VASSSIGLLSSLYKLAEQKVQVVVTMNYVKLFSVELGCVQDKPHEMSRTELSTGALRAIYLRYYVTCILMAV
jgi:hypothetical protein